MTVESTLSTISAASFGGAGANSASTIGECGAVRAAAVGLAVLADDNCHYLGAAFRGRSFLPEKIYLRNAYPDATLTSAAFFASRFTTKKR